ncbi:MAG: MFS transporter [Symbiobacteriia bacterium]
MGSFNRVFRNRPFLLLWVGQTISRLGDVLYYAGMLWLVKELTHSNTATGLAGTAMALPQLLGPLAGVFVDRWPRRRILLFTDLIRGVLVLVVPLLHWWGRLSAGSVIAVVFALSLVGQLFYPAERAMMTELVEGDDLVQANSLDNMALSATNIFGFLLGGTLIAWIGPVQLFSLDGLSFFISALFIVWMGTALARASRGQGVGRAAGQGHGRGGILAEIKEGLLFLWETPLTRVVIPAAVVINFVFGPAMVLLPSYATDVLGAGARGFGYLEGALAAGMLLGAAAVPVLVRYVPRIWAMGGGLAAMALAMVGVGLSVHLIPSLLLFGAVGVANAIVNVIFMTLLQAMIPPQLQGRTFASLMTLVSIFTPIGLGISGILADRFSVPAVYVAAGLITMATALAVTVPMLRAFPDCPDTSYCLH